MTMEQRYAFFAPVWRVMRNDNVSVEEVGRQIRYVALSVKQGSQVGGWGCGCQACLRACVCVCLCVLVCLCLRCRYTHKHVCQILAIGAQGCGASDQVTEHIFWDTGMHIHS